MEHKRVRQGFVYGLAGLFTATFVALNLAGIITLLVFFFSPFAFAGGGIAQNEQANAKCLSCHSQPGFNVVKGSATIDLYVDKTQYQASIHGTRACTSCHSDLGGVPHTNPVYGQELAQQVNQQCVACHTDEGKAYLSSIHGEQLIAGKEGAACSDCHGKHNIQKSSDPVATTYRLTISNICMNCHQGKVAQSYNYSFHGTAIKLGYTKSATCADCHGTHAILPPENPNSSVSKQNEPQTCAQCHLQAQPNFAQGNEHAVPQDQQNDFPLWIVWKIFLGLIVFDILKDGSIAVFELIRRLINTRRNTPKS
ncbi:MAG: cytochrome c3 family protein [Peptococcaceae bacterium]|nr:cytochrome c3 family protein [Peptococcaceae bacterium]